MILFLFVHFTFCGRREGVRTLHVQFRLYDISFQKISTTSSNQRNAFYTKSYAPSSVHSRTHVRKRGDSNITCSVHLADILLRFACNLSRKIFESLNSTPYCLLFRTHVVRCGRGGIRTPDAISRIHDFESCAFNLSAILPHYFVRMAERSQSSPPRFARIRLCPTQFYPLSHSSLFK